MNEEKYLIDCIEVYRQQYQQAIQPYLDRLARIRSFEQLKRPFLINVNSAVSSAAYPIIETEGESK